MYLCKICGACSRPRDPLLRHVVERTVPCERFTRDGIEQSTRREIAAEVPVCASCQRALRSGELTLERALAPKPVNGEPAAPAPLVPQRAF